MVDGIPAGHIREFYGQLSKDSLGSSAAVTHEGWDSDFISRDQTAEVQLYLAKKGNGSAHVCIHVEDWSADSSCNRPPPPPSITTNCFSVSQSLLVGKSGSGRMAIRIDSSSVSGILRWTGFANMTFQGKVIGSLKDTANIDIYGIAPKGMIDTTGIRVDILHYRAIIPGRDSLMSFSGSVLRLLPVGLKANGSWKGIQSNCTVKDSIP